MAGTCPKKTKHIHFYEAFTLIEMLIVLAIIIIISGFAYAGIANYRSAMAVINTSSLIEQDIKMAQRSAMFLSRDVEEGWIYGIGIDFSQIDNAANPHYRFFKWCAPFEEFNPMEPKMNSELPGVDTANLLSIDNGYLPGYTTGKTLCDGTNELIEFKPSHSTEIDRGALRITKAEGVRLEDVNYILFESITGRAFLYGATISIGGGTGTLLNYSLSSGNVTMYPDLTHLQIKLTNIGVNPATSGRTIDVSPVSGRVKIL